MKLAASLISVLLCAPSVVLAEETPDKFEQGVEAYRSGDYAAALAAFLEAQPAGWSAANLQFNLGLTYYRLHRYQEARVEFEHLRTYPGYRDIADYHLGLIAARLGDRDRALTLWQPLESSAPEQALRDRAGAAIGRIAPRGTGPDVYLAATVGYDSNPALLDDSALPGGGASASLDLLGTVESALSRTDQRVIAAHGGGYLRRYSDDNGLDQAGLFVGLARQTRVNDQDRSLALDAGTSRLDGEHFLDSIGIGATESPVSGTGGAAYGAQLTRIQAATGFEYLQGWRTRGTAEWVARDPARPWRLGYQLEINDRKDLASGGEFFSHSPIRHGVGFVLPQARQGGWSLQWSARYRYSAYRKADVFLENGALRTERRIDQLLLAGVRVRKKTTASTFLFLEYEYSHNASTIDAFDYDRHLLQLGLEWFSLG